MEPYPAYKNSGVQWLGQIPDHWEMRRIDRLFTLRNEPPQAGDGRVTGYLDGRVTLRSNVAGQKIKGVIKDAGWQRIHAGDFAISGMNAHLGGMGVSDSLGQCSPIYLVLEPKADTNAQYVSHAVRYIAHTGILKTLVNTIRFNSADFKRDDLKQIRVWLPSQEEQKQIVHFISQFTIRTNHLIKAKRRLIELLHEQKQAVIHRAVTVGLDPDAPRKPSGVDWLGDIPAHWQVRKLKFVADCNPSKQELVGRSSAQDRVVFLPMEKVGVDGSIDCSDIQQAEAISSGFTYFRRHDVLIAKITPCFENSKGAYLGSIPTEYGFGSTEYIVLRAKAAILPEFLWLITTLAKFRQMGVDRMVGAAGQQRVPVEFIRHFAAPVPPIKEQREILKWVSAEKMLMSATIERTQREINLIREYRTRLIADVVTGKIDVRGAVLPVLETAAEWDNIESDDEDADALDEAGEAMDADAQT